MADTAFVKTEIIDEVLHVTLARAERMNAFDPQMIQQIKEVFLSAGQNKRLAAVLLKGEGKSFCAGADLEYMRAMAKYSASQNQADSEQLFDMFEAVRSCPHPVVVWAHGSVFGGGVGLVAAADLVAVETVTQFCFSEVRLGLIPAVISSYVLNKMNMGFARAMMISGQIFSGEQAVAQGLAHFSGSNSECETWISKTLAQLKANGPEAMTKVKELCDLLVPLKIPEQKSRAAKAIAERRVSAEGQEGITAFLEKRKPRWARK